MSLTKLPRNWKRMVVLTDSKLPEDFNATVRMLTRPYFSITDTDAQWLDSLTKESNKGDIIMVKGCYMTWGECSNGAHLMNLVLSD